MTRAGNTASTAPARASGLTGRAAALAFLTYFCMYSYRKPFAAARYDDLAVAGFDLKTALVISQVCGYALSKLLGVKLNSELPPARRALALVLIIAWAEAALLLFAVVPPWAKPIALFLNGLPLGMVWGVVFSFLEGRRTSEILGAALSCSYIVASGAVKSVGAWLLGHGVSESWMPALAGLLFTPLFLLAVRGLARLPAPSVQDQRERVARAPMDRRARRAFLGRYLPGVSMLVVVYLFLTSYRDLRDNFAAELWQTLGYSDAPAVFTATELPIALLVMVVLALLYLVRDNRLGLLATYAIMITGSLLLGIGTLLLDLGLISGVVWMILVGLGLYLAYVPYGCVLFDRMIAALGFVATAVFLIYVSDAVAYSGSVLIMLYKELGQPDLPVMTFFRYFSYATSAITAAGFLGSALYFGHRARR